MMPRRRAPVIALAPRSTPPPPATPEDQYLVPATDQHGQSARVQVRIPPQLARAAEMVFEGKQFPFEVLADLWRYCLQHGLEALSTHGPPAGPLSQARVLQRLLADERRNAAFLDVFATLDRTVAAYLAAEAKPEAQRLVARVRAEILQMPEGWWRDRYLKTLRQRHGQLLR